MHSHYLTQMPILNEYGLAITVSFFAHILLYSSLKPLIKYVVKGMYTKKLTYVHPSLPPFTKLKSHHILRYADIKHKNVRTCSSFTTYFISRAFVAL